MKHRFPTIFAISLFLLVLCLPQIQGQRNSRGDPSNPRLVTFPFREFKDHLPGYYVVDTSNLPANVELSFAVTPQQINKKSVKAHDLLISRSKVPLNAKEADFSTKDISGNVLMITREEMQGAKQLYITILCPDAPHCKSNVAFEYARELFYEANGEKKVFHSGILGEDSSSIVRLKVPKVANANRIVIHIDSVAKKKGDTPTLKVYLTKGHDIPDSENSEKIVRSSWFEGTTLVIYDDNKIFCTGCDYTLSLKFNEFSMVSIEAHVFTKSTDLKRDAVLDGVKNGKLNQYTFEIKEAHREEDFVISVKPQQGSVKVYINCDVMPADYRISYWNYEIYSAEDIVLTPREHSRCKTETYYLTVDSDESSVYSLKASYSDNHRLIIGSNFPIVGDIFPQEKISYDILVPVFAVDKVEIKLNTRKNINLQITQCRFPTDCPTVFPADEKSKYPTLLPSDDYNTDGFNYTISKLQGGGKKVVISPQESGCYPILVKDKMFNYEATPVCAYKLILVATETQPVEYKLSADMIGHRWLFAGAPKLDSVEAKQTKNYVLYVPHKDAQTVEIQVTVFSGDVDVFVSRTEKYPGANTDATEFSHEGFILFKKRHNQGLDGHYYISVYGVVSSSYSISTFVQSESGTDEDYALALEEGLPQRGVLLPNQEHPVQFYKINLNQYLNWEGSIVISVTTMRGNVILAVNNNDEVPAPNGKHKWMTKTGTLEISSQDEFFTKRGVYHIGVFVDWENVPTKSIDEITFTIRYFINDGGSELPRTQYIYLSPLTPYSGVIRKGETHYFEMEVLKSDAKLTIFKQVDVGDVDLFVAYDNKVQYPSESKHDVTTRNTYRNYISLSTPNIMQACQNFLQPGMCTIRMAVVLSGPYTESYYTLSIKKEYKTPDVKPIALANGVQFQSQLPKNNSIPALFYYYAGNQQSVVTVTCPGIDITIFALRKNIEVGTSFKFDGSQIPSKKLRDYSSRDGQNFGQGHSHITVAPADQGKTTVIVLAVYFNDPDTKKNTYFLDFLSFTIVVSTEISHLYTGYPYYGAVPKDTYSYFYVNVYRPDCTLLISLTNLDDGDPDLVVSFGANERPTIEDHQFASISLAKAEVLEINNLDIYPRESMAGTWVIGVYGRKASAFTLTVVYEDDKMVDLKLGTPFEMFLKRDSTLYLKFFQEQSKTMNVKLDTFSGELDAYITTLDGNKDLASNLPNSSHHNWKINSYGKGTLTIPNTDKNYCKKCLYIIALEAKMASKFSIIVTAGETKYTQVQSGLAYSDQLSPKSTKTFVFSGRNVEEASLNVYMTGGQLQVYVSNNPTVNSTHKIWYGQLTSTSPSLVLSLPKEDAKNSPVSVWDGIRLAPTDKDAFYVQFDNIGSYDVDFTFIPMTKEGNVVLKSGVPYVSSISAYKKNTYLFYYSQEGDTLKFKIEYSLMEDNYELDYDRPLALGLPINARYWPEGKAAGLGEYVFLNTEQIIPHYVENRGEYSFYTFTQIMTTHSRPGKLSFEVQNPYDALLNIEVKIISNAVPRIKMDQDSQHSAVLTPGKSEALEVFVGNGGKWYLSVFACEGDVGFSILENNDEVSVPSLGNGPESRGKYFLYSAGVQAQTTKLVKVTNNAQGNSHYLLSSSQFFEKKIYDYEPKNTSFPVDYDYRYGRKGSTLVVNLKALHLDEGLDPTDEVSYHVRVCPDSGDDSKNNLCTLKGDCKLAHVKRRVNDRKDIQVKIEKVRDGRYYVQTTAYIQHLQKMVRMIPYDVIDVEISETLSSKVSDMIGTIILGIVMFIIAGIICIKCYKKFQALTEERGFELQMFTKKKGYNVLGEE